MADVIPWDRVCARRLARHGLSAPLDSIATAARAMCATHAQVMPAAELSLGLRVEGTTRGDVAAALWDERSIVKTIGPRGTWHLVPADELADWCAALAAVPRHSGHADGVRLDEAQQADIVAAIDDALADAELTIDQLDVEVAARCGAWAGELTMPAFGGNWPRWRQAIGSAAVAGVLCSGPNRGRRVTYTSPRRWLAGFAPVADAERAVDRVARDYLHSYGPATPEQFAQWLAAPKPWARAVFARLDLAELDLDGEPAWVNAGDTDFGEAAEGLWLLPYFDSFVVGSHPRRLLFPGAASTRARVRGGGAGNFAVLFIDAAVAGVWHQRRSGRTIAITVEPLDRLDARRSRALADEVDRIGTILEGRAELRIGTVTVGPHA